MLWALLLTALPAERVVLVSFDGLRPDAIEKLGEKRAPSFFRLMREGSYTLDARTDPRLTYTIPNHACMLTGRSGLVRTNQFDGATIHQLAGRYVPSMFDVVAKTGGRVAMVASKHKFLLFAKSYARRLDAIQVSNIDDDRSLAEAMKLLGVTTPPKLTFLHFAGPDVAGHTFGFGGTEYDAAVARMDAILGRILFAIGARSSLRTSTILIVTSDHGGQGPTHLDPNVYENYRVPFFVWGDGVGPGDLYALNPRRKHPGESRGDRPIRNCDAGNLALSMLGLSPVPGSEFLGDLTTQAADRVRRKEAGPSRATPIPVGP